MSAPVKSLSTAIADDFSKPANCFTLTDGRLEENFQIDIGHPLWPEGPALVVSDEIVFPRSSFNGCIYKPQGDKATVHRALLGIGFIGGTKRKMLRRPEHDDLPYALVYVHFGLSEGARLRSHVEKLWSGVTGAEDAPQGDEYALIAVWKGQTLKVFYPDGMVGQVAYDELRSLASAGKRITMLSPIDALEARLAHNTTVYDRAKERTGDPSFKAIGWTFHQLATMIRVTAKKPELLRPITKLISERAKERPIDASAQHHLREALRFVGANPDGYDWLRIREIPQKTHGAPKKRSGKSGRAERDKEYRAAMKGSNPPADKHGQGKAKN